MIGGTIPGYIEYLEYQVNLGNLEDLKRLKEEFKSRLDERTDMLNAKFSRDISNKANEIIQKQRDIGTRLTKGKNTFETKVFQDKLNTVEDVQHLLNRYEKFIKIVFIVSVENPSLDETDREKKISDYFKKINEDYNDKVRGIIDDIERKMRKK
jgi:hypothetical protein